MRLLPALLILCLPLATFAAEEAKDAPRKIVLIAGKKSHGAGAHDYERTMRLFKVMLDNSNVADQVRVEVHEKGWPADEKTLDDADTIVFYSDGKDGDLYSEVPFVIGNRMETLQKQMQRGCGLMTMHFSTFVNDKQGEKVLDWVGGYFDWQDDAGKRNWYSKIGQIELIELASRDHAISRGVPRMAQLRDEVYWKLRFRPDDKRITPIWRALNVKDEENAPHFNTVGWAIERADGGRGFGTSVGHGYRLWQDEGIRKLFLNAIVWTAKAEVPEEGVQSKFYSDDQVKEALQGKKGTDRAVVESPIKVLLFTGNEAHAWHNGDKSTPAVVAALEADKRIQVDVSQDIEDLGRKKLSDYSAIVLNNYCNWHDPKGLSEPAKKAFLAYLEQGGGLVVVHFANGAFHSSLPEAGASDWPEYRKIVRRVWDHHGQGESQSSHDAFGKFTVNIAKNGHPIVAGLKPFEVTDELYFRQAGSEPIEPIISAKSQVTKQEEPLAWTYDYANARVFQTLLGHSEKTYDTYEAREMLRRGVAWVAKRKIVPVSPEQETLIADVQVDLVEGRFGKALNAKAQGVLLQTKAELADVPLTVECWTKLNSKQNFNILVASEEKTSLTHWELYSYAGSGVCSVYLPGRGGEFKSEVDICDGRWHHVGFSLADEQVRLFVDGKQVLERPVKKLAERATSGAIGVGRLVDGSLGCDGLIDDLHISRGILDLAKLPDAPRKREEATRLLLAVDNVSELVSYLPRSAAVAPGPKNAAVPKPTVSNSKAPHWGQEGIGFKWKEEDSRDDRWKDSEIGRFLASSLPLGSAAGTVAKGLSIRLGDEQEATVCYDTANLKLRAAWSGGFLRFTPARYGLIMPPVMDGEPQFLATESPGWDAKSLQYRGMRVYGERIVLEYEVDGVRVEESPWVEHSGDQLAFVRMLDIAPSPQPLVMRLAEKLAKDDSVELRSLKNMNVAIWKSGDVQVAFACPKDGATWRLSDSGELRLEIAPHTTLTRLTICFGAWPEESLERIAEEVRIGKLGVKSYFRKESKPKWTEEIVTQGKVAANDAPYVVDTITLPFDNPYRSLFFVSGHDSFSGGLVLCTVHGDVWMVRGVDDKLERLTWKRYATGLFQPLGVVLKRNKLYVLGRDQITVLHDENRDGEADHYQCFTNKMPTSPGGHDYTACLETDDDGNFYFLTAHEGIWRLSPDGQKLDNIVGGLRNPNGLGVGPGPIITVAPQEGNWTPASYIGEAKPGDYFGFGGPKITPDRPLGWTQPLCFLPRRRDNSSGGQVWATSERWGPLANQLLHFSYGQCRMMVVLREVIDGQAQGGTVEMSPLFESGAMRGRFSPYDGQLYVSGLRGWTTAATQDGCLQRVRYTGQSVHLPVKFRTLQNGVAISFTDALKREAAEDVGNYHLEQWNYRYRESYGSPDFKVSDSKQEGHDVVRVESATLLEDGRTVFLEIPDLKPVNQLTIGYALTAANGEEFRNTIAYTIHKLAPEQMDSSLLHRQSTPGRLTEAEEKALKPGLIASLEGDGEPQTFVVRMATLHFNGPHITNARRDEPLKLLLDGYLHVPLKGEYQIGAEGRGSVSIHVNNEEVFTDSENLDKTPATVALHSGYNKLRIEYESKEVLGEMFLRLMWATADSPLEPVPPTALFHRGDDPSLVKSQQLEQGKQLFADRFCAKCHSLPPGNWPQGIHQPPSLANVGNRLNKEWLAQWLLNPSNLRNHTAMPGVFDANKKEDRQAAANLAAWLAERKEGESDAQPVAQSDDLVEQGRDLYENLNCIACHKLTSPGEDDEFDRISLHYVHAKYQPGALREYLREPHRHHPTNRMPDFKLSEQDTVALASYLAVAAAGGKVEAIPELATANVQLAREQFKDHRCDACHRENENHGIANVVHNSFRRPTEGCLTNDPVKRGTAPAFDFTPDERRALTAFLTGHDEQKYSLRTPAGISQALYQELRCNACHKRDGEQGARMAILTEESERGLTPELLPDLTWAGEKLQREWMEKQIAGKVETRIRPWLAARMPAFPAYAEELAKGMEAEHGISIGHGGSPHPKDDLAKIGEQLTLKENLDCRQCHGIGDLEPMGDDKTKLAPGINFAFVKERLRHDYYKRFVLDPPRWDISTRMPKLAADGRTTKVTSFYDGDAEKQFEAIWYYIQTVQKPKPR
jgi:type 1 glutamine amidotransferase/mono/diheme cytochrome c family protein/glucose/arabinose dehydrogenase